LYKAETWFQRVHGYCEERESHTIASRESKMKIYGTTLAEIETASQRVVLR
jgi:hypothetical protein